MYRWWKGDGNDLIYNVEGHQNLLAEKMSAFDILHSGLYLYVYTCCMQCCLYMNIKLLMNIKDIFLTKINW